MRKVQKDRVDAVFEYVMNSSSHTFENYLRGVGGWIGVETTGANIKMECPFHSDSSPSLYLDEINKRFHCFSCGRGGKYLNFVLYYEQLINGSSMKFYDHVNAILMKDTKMQLSLGYSTIYRMESYVNSDTPYQLRTFNKEKVLLLSTPLELANRMIKEGITNPDIILLACTYIQDGIVPEEVYRMVKRDRQDLDSSEEENDLFDLSTLHSFLEED